MKFEEIMKEITNGLTGDNAQDVKYHHLPLRDYNSMLDTLRCVVRDYDKIGHWPSEYTERSSHNRR